jgi:DNA ligase D-like protein (predicted ligase)
MTDLLLKIGEKEKLKRKKQPNWTNPMLAKLAHNVFSNKDWIFERKLDGERCLIFKKKKQVNILSRNKINLNDTYPEIITKIQKQKTKNFIIDGEVVAFKGKVTSFSELQHRMHLKNVNEIESNTKVYYYVFDIIYYDGFDLSGMKLRARKKVLKGIFKYEDPIRFLPHRNEIGEKYFKEACKKGWEGLIAKNADGKYIHKRSSEWLKFKCVNQQEFVIGGYTDPQGERIGFGALLLGYYKNDDLQYAGKVGTGYDDETLKDLHKKLSKIEKGDPEFIKKKDLPSKNIHWVKPKYIAEIGFTQWTKNNKLRHPRYLGLRRDKEPKEVIQEK